MRKLRRLEDIRKCTGGPEDTNAQKETAVLCDVENGQWCKYRSEKTVTWKGEERFTCSYQPKQQFF